MQSSNKCKRCGKSPVHIRSMCPAKDAKCLKCKKKGHYMCRWGGGGAEVKALGDSDDSNTFLGVLSTSEITNVGIDPWKIPIKVNGTEVLFKVDTGADVSVIPESDVKKLNVTVKRTNKVLTGPCKNQLSVCGSFGAQLITGDKSADQVIYVVQGLRLPLLGRPAVEALNIVSVVQQVQISTDELYKKFPQVFDGLGKLDGEYHFHLRDDARPYVVTTPRRIPLLLMDRVKEELNKMEKQGVIVKSDENHQFQV